MWEGFGLGDVEHEFARFWRLLDVFIKDQADV